MTDKCEVVTVVRKDHPEGKVDINKSDMTDKDVVWTKPAPKPKVTKNATK